MPVPDSVSQVWIFLAFSFHPPPATALEGQKGRWAIWRRGKTMRLGRSERAAHSKQPSFSGSLQGEKIKIYSLTIVEARSPKPVSLDWNQGMKKATVPLEDLGEILLLPLPAPGGSVFLAPWPHHHWVCLHGHTPSSLLYNKISLWFSLTRIHVIAFLAHPDYPR